ncbi:MAG: YhcH/YjgK/YiaL family protein [Candidatus Omnitrophota bacterium]
MIHDNITNLKRYALPFTDLIQDFISTHRLASLPLIEKEIKGRELFVRPAEYNTRMPEEGRFEIHRFYMDVQYVFSGSERMQSVPADLLVPITEYDASQDIHFFNSNMNITDVFVNSGEFVVYFPGEAHRPMCQSHARPERVRKFVFKIKIE